MQTATKVPTDDFFTTHEFQPTCAMCEIHPAIWIVKWHGCITTLCCDECWEYEKRFFTTRLVDVKVAAETRIQVACGYCRRIFTPADMVTAEPINPH